VNTAASCSVKTRSCRGDERLLSPARNEWIERRRRQYEATEALMSPWQHAHGQVINRT